MKKSIISLSNGIVWSNICKNRASSISIMSAALIASLLLSILCSFFYNMWLYDVESVVLEEGDWQARIVGTVSEEELELIRSFGNITKAVAHEEDADCENTNQLPELRALSPPKFVPALIPSPHLPHEPPLLLYCRYIRRL